MRSFYFSIKYKTVRFLTKCIVFSLQKILFQKKDLEPVILIGKGSITLLMKSFMKYFTNVSIPKNLSVNVHQLTFPSPITFAAYEAHLPLLELFLRIGIGGGCIKTMMIHAQDGNPKPRIQELIVDNQPSLINALGLPGKGVNAMAMTLKKSQLLSFNRPIGLSIGGHNINDYKIALSQYESHVKQFTNIYYELNISCPNTEEGQDLVHNPTLLQELLSYCRQHTDHVMSVKLTPDLPNQTLLDLGNLISSFDLMMINIGNTTKRTCEQVGLAPDSISVGAGGLSGPTLFTRTLEMIHLLQPLNVPLIATGGIDSSEKIQTCLDAGAALVGMATALVMDPFQVIKFNRELAK